MGFLCAHLEVVACAEKDPQLVFVLSMTENHYLIIVMSTMDID